MASTPIQRAEPLTVKHVLLEPNVEIRDNKGTSDPFDDMKVVTTTLDSDEPTQRITTESHVVIEDSEMITTGDGMLVQLGKSETAGTGGSTGFSGVEHLELLKNVHVIMHDAGKSGIMPGGNEPRSRSKRPGKGKVELASAHARENERRTNRPTHSA